MRRYGYIMIAGLMVIGIFLFSSLTVMGQESKKLHVCNEYYHELKEEYVQNVRDELEKKGYRNCGVTVCETLEADGDRTYTVTIHHKRIDKMDSREQMELLQELGQLPFGDSQCKIERKILSYAP